MPKANYQPTIEECKDAYWNAIDAYTAIREDQYSTWWQLRDAAAAVADCKADWEMAVLATVERRQPTAMRKRIARSLVLDCLADAGRPTWKRED